MKDERRLLPHLFSYVVLLLSAAEGVTVPSWNYVDQNGWGAYSSTCTAGTMQSPMEIFPQSVIRNVSLQLDCNYLTSHIPGTGQNTGRAIEFKVTSKPLSMNTTLCHIIHCDRALSPSAQNYQSFFEFVSIWPSI